MQLRSYTSVLWHRRWIVGITFGIVMAIVIVALATARSEYEANTSLRIVPSASLTDATVREDAITYVDRLENTYAEILEGDSLRDEVRDQVGVDGELTITAVARPNTELMDVVATASRSEDAVAAADAAAAILISRVAEIDALGVTRSDETFDERMAELEAAIATDQSRVNSLNRAGASPGNPEVLQLEESIRLQEAAVLDLRREYERDRLARRGRAESLVIVEPASPPEGRSSPRPGLYVGVGLVVAVIAAVGAGFLVENLRPRLHTRRDVESIGELNVLAEIPWSAVSEPSLFNGGSPAEESFQLLRTVLFFGKGPRVARTVLVTSVEQAAGKSTVVANLARSVAKWDKKVVVVDADTRQPTQHDLFGVSNDVGLSDVLGGDEPEQRALHKTTVPNLHVLPSGPPISDPAGALSSRTMRGLIRSLTKDFELVVIDSPPMLDTSDALALAPLVDGVLLVTQAGRVAPRDLDTLRRKLSQVGASPLGVVLNGAAPLRGTYATVQRRSEHGQHE